MLLRENMGKKYVQATIFQGKHTIQCDSTHWYISITYRLFLVLWTTKHTWIKSECFDFTKFHSNFSLLLVSMKILWSYGLTFLVNIYFSLSFSLEFLNKFLVWKTIFLNTFPCCFSKQNSHLTPVCILCGKFK